MAYWEPVERELARAPRSVVCVSVLPRAPFDFFVFQSPRRVISPERARTSTSEIRGLSDFVPVWPSLSVAKPVIVHPVRFTSAATSVMASTPLRPARFEPPHMASSFDLARPDVASVA